MPFCNERFFLSAYADDVTVFVNGSDDLNVLQSIVNDFNFLSSAKVSLAQLTMMQLCQPCQGHTDKITLKVEPTSLNQEERGARTWPWERLLSTTPTCQR